MTRLETLCGLAFVATLALLAGCASTPLHFHSLIEPGLTTPPRSSNFPALSIAVDPVSIPAQVDMPQLIVRSRSGDIRLLETHRWIAPLAEEIRASISLHLQADLGAVDVSRIQSAPNASTYRVKIDVQRLETVIGGNTLLSAAWSVHRSNPPQTLTHCVFQTVEAAADDPQAHVLAYRRALDALAREVAKGIELLSKDPANAGCPSGG